MNLMKDILAGYAFVFLNYFVANIPSWWVRRLFYLAFGMKIGGKSRIAMKVMVFSPWKITIGENTMINEYSILDGRGSLSVGNNVSISQYTIIYSASHKTDSDTFEYYKNHVSIHDNVWLGARAIILPGSIINKGSVIAAGSSFTGETVENGIYSGVPAVLKRIRKIGDDYALGKHSFFFK
jgi:maltose O-acetyltransferase